jgi:hypothetical protein
MFPDPTSLASYPNQGPAPTVFASSPNQGVLPTGVTPASGQPVPPQPANLYAPQPPTNYGENTPPPPPSVNPYDNTYNTPQYDPSGLYGVSPSLPTYGAPGTYGTPPQFALAPQQPQKKSNSWVIALVVVLVVVVLGVGGVFAAGAIIAHNAISSVSSDLQTAVPTIDASLTPTATTGTTDTGNAPDASQIDPTAASMILTYQTSSGVNTSTFQAVDSKTTFNVGDKIYVVFTTAGQDGYILAKWYLNGQHGFDSNILQDSGGDTAGYVAGYFNLSGDAVIGLYWCTLADCSDAALAQVVSVTVS